MNQTFKNNLRRAIFSALKLILIGSIFVAALELATDVFQIPISLHWIALFYLAREMAVRIRGHVFYEHKIYPILAVVAMILLYYVSGIWATIIINVAVFNTIHLNILLFAINPAIRFMFLYPFSGYFFSLYNIIDVIFFAAILILAYRYTK